jgi:hypothetical protein
MKKIVILMLAAFLTSVSVPVFAADVKATKDECLLASKDCKNDVDSIQQKIKKLQTEIKKGSKVYSAEEIKKLDAKLKEANALLDGLLANP